MTGSIFFWIAFYICKIIYFLLLLLFFIFYFHSIIACSTKNEKWYCSLYYSFFYVVICFEIWLCGILWIPTNVCRKCRFSEQTVFLINRRWIQILRFLFQEATYKNILREIGDTMKSVADTSFFNNKKQKDIYLSQSLHKSNTWR